MTIEELTTYFREQLDAGAEYEFTYQLLTGSSESDNGVVHMKHFNTLESFLPFANTFDFIEKINTGTQIVPRFGVRIASPQ